MAGATACDQDHCVKRGTSHCAVEYVPPNDKLADQRNKKYGPPGFRERQPRRFPAAIPDDRVVRLYWEDGDQGAQRLEPLCRLQRIPLM